MNDRNDCYDDTPDHLWRKARARHLLRLARERRSVEAELEQSGCTFRGRVLPRHRRLSWALDRIAHEEERAWAA